MPFRIIRQITIQETNNALHLAQVFGFLTDVGFEGGNGCFGVFELRLELIHQSLQDTQSFLMVLLLGLGLLELRGELLGLFTVGVGFRSLRAKLLDFFRLLR